MKIKNQKNNSNIFGKTSTKFTNVSSCNEQQKINNSNLMSKLVRSQTKTAAHQNNAIFFLVPLLAIILKETDALPPIIKIGKNFKFIFTKMNFGSTLLELDSSQFSIEEVLCLLIYE